ncbi:hypothetical protein ABZT47_38390 [Sphaerisporangium sp. NPDC005289]|uniref:hypothetical protein n=1 Tax=Sphaerisporangium sp. NPDC005289 TaxID=3155247 RepID=UPI0033A175F0
MASRPPLTPQSAEITTATVEIKALTVNGKQVTLAVFRQLYEEPLYDSRTWQSFGTPWCRVNYHPDRCDRDPVAHEHVVWQKGDELRRARLDRPSGKLDDVPRFDEHPDDELAACVAMGSISNARITSVKGTRGYSTSSESVPEKPAAYVAGAFDTGREITAKLFLSSPNVASLMKGYGGQPHPTLETEHARIHPDARWCTDASRRRRR